MSITMTPGATPTPRGGAMAGVEARAITLLAATLHAEAGTRPVRAIEALAALVMNRARLAAADEAGRLRFAPALPARGRFAWPSLMAAACRAPFLFACWRDAAGRAALAASAARDDAGFAACRRIAARALARTLEDPTEGATHWHTAEAMPAWAIGLIPVTEIGGLVFYRVPRAS